MPHGQSACSDEQIEISRCHPAVEPGVTAVDLSATRPTPRPVVESSVKDVDGYQRSVSGVAIEAVREGVGVGPNTVRSVSDGRLTSSSCQIGFPILTRTTISDDYAVLALMQSTAPGSRWIGIDVRPGLLLGYAPGAEHAAVNRPGLRFTFAAVAVDELRKRAGQLGFRADTPTHGAALELPPEPESAAVAELLALVPVIPPGRTPPLWLLDDLLSAWASTLAALPHGWRDRTVTRTDSHRIVRACIDYATSAGRRPSILELVVASRVPERRVRQAFISVYDKPPSEFFREWALTEAHRRLSIAKPSDVTVAQIAEDVGFTHLGRFPGYYRQVYEELPSTTLDRPPSDP
jgi:AraC-like DNA-binding protein